MQEVRPTSCAAATNALSPRRVLTCLFACVFMSCATLAQAMSASNFTAHSAKGSAQGGAQGGQTSGGKGGAKGGPNGGQNGGRSGPPNGGGPETKTTSPATGKDPAIQWYATLERGLAEAKRTNKPILFVTGAPHCSGVSGMWCPGKKKIDAQKFVCIRLTSYESQSEAAFIEKLRGNPVNTAFAILTPQGEPALKVQGLGRGPSELFSDTADMVKQMNEVAAKYVATDVAQGAGASGAAGSASGATRGAANTNAAQTPLLPVTLNAKLGLAVASADLQPLVLVVASDAAARAALEAKVAKLAWSKDFEGFFTYANAANTKSLVLTSATNNGAANTSSSNAANTAAITKDSVLIIEPDIFGAAGKIVAQISASDVDTQLSSAMKSARTNHVRMEKSREQLKRMALAQGIYFETGIPVSGKREAEDRAKYKQQLDSRKKAL
jgi:hypothetical protein